MNNLQKALETTEETIKALQSYAEDIRNRMQPAIGVNQWQPKGGDWWIDEGGEVVEVQTSSPSREFGLERQTQKQAERAAVEMRRFNRLLALRDELCGNDLEVVDLFSDCKKYYVYSCHRNKEKKWSYTDCSILTSIGVYFTTAKTAQKACNMLNSGEVEL